MPGPVFQCVSRIAMLGGSQMTEIFFAGGPVMYPLLICSIITLAVIIDRTIFWLRYRNGRRPDLIAEMFGQAKCGGKSLPDVTRSDLIARVLVEGLKSPLSEASWRMRQAAAREEQRVTCYLGVLNTMVSLAVLRWWAGDVPTADMFHHHPGRHH